MIYPHTAWKVYEELARVTHTNTDHWLQFTTGTQDGSTKTEVCNMYIFTGTKVSTCDEET